LLATLAYSFTDMAYSSAVLSPEEQTQVAQTLEEDAQVMSNTQLVGLLEGQPSDVQEEILRINAESRIIALRVALLVPLIAALLGLLNSFRMVRLPDPEPSNSAEMLLG